MDEPRMTNQSRREKQLQDMVTTSDGRAEICRLARMIQGVQPHGSLCGMFIGQMISDILRVEFEGGTQRVEVEAVRKSDAKLESVAIITQIQTHFIAKGWKPLLQVTVDGLVSLSIEKLQSLLPKATVTDRISAVTAIMEGLIPETDPPLSGVV